MRKITEILVLFLAVATAVIPCGPFFEKSAMISYDGPVRTKPAFMQEPGIVLPGFKADYLALAYLPLSGKKYNAVTMALALSSVQENDEQKLWLEARAKFLKDNTMPYINVYLPMGDYRSGTNCHEDAFRYARELLTGRLNSPHTRLWVTNQDIVFANCSTVSGQLTPPPQDAPMYAQKDFAYQQAALLFYRRNFDAAFSAFEKISKDRASEHLDLAKYMMVRTRMRQGGYFSDFPEAKAVPFESFGPLIEEILASRARDKVKADTQALKRRWQAKEDGYAASIAQELIEGKRDANPVEIAADLRYLIRIWEYKYDSEGAKASQKESLTKTLFKRAKDHDLLQWVIAYRAQDEISRQFSEQRFKATGLSHWLIAVLAKLRPGDASVNTWLEHAAKITPDHPAYATVAFYRLILAGQRGKFDSKLARELREKLQTAGDDSSVNLVRALEFRFAANLGEAIAASERKLLGKSTVMPEHTHGFDSDAAFFLTHYASLGDYGKMLKSAAISEADKLEIARAGWVRSVLLNSAANEKEFAKILVRLDKSLSGEFANLDRIDNAETRRAATLLLILRNPGLKPYIAAHHGRRGAVSEIDSFRENWWCKLGGKREENTGWDHYLLYETLDDQVFSALYAGQRQGLFPFAASGLKEFAELTKNGGAADFLAGPVFAATEKNPADKTLAEALHRLVKVTRYGCGGPNNGKISKRAFRLLHKSFPDSEWAKKTPYWYE